MAETPLAFPSQLILVVVSTSKTTSAQKNKPELRFCMQVMG